MARRKRPQKSSSQDMLRPRSHCPKNRCVVNWRLAVSTLTPCCVKAPFACCTCGNNLAARDAELGARFQNAEARLAQGQVLLIGGLDEVIEDRVVEDGPPLAVVAAF